MCDTYSYSLLLYLFFFFNDAATTEIYTYGHTLSLHDALPIFHLPCVQRPAERARFRHGEQWDRAAHRGDTVERKPLARHFARLLPALLHHFHAVARHRSSRHFDHRRAGATGERRLLTEQAAIGRQSGRERVCQ